MRPALPFRRTSITGHNLSKRRPESQQWSARRRKSTGFQRALNQVQWDNIQVTVPAWSKRHEGQFLIATLEPRGRPPRFVITNFTREREPRGWWLRSYPHDSLLSRPHWTLGKSMTVRLALDHRGRFYIRAPNIEGVAPFLDRFARQPTAVAPPLAEGTEPGSQIIVIGFVYDLQKMFAAVLKNGFNFFAHWYGADIALHQNFQRLRDILLDKQVRREWIQRYCRFGADETDDFPSSGNALEHRILLDIVPGGMLRCRIRLFDSLGYEMLLGLCPAELRSSFRPRKAVVDYRNDGIREVEVWPSVAA